MVYCSQLAQIIALTVVLIAASFVPVFGLAVALAEVRLPLAMVLAVAICYQWLSQPALARALIMRRITTARWRGSRQ